MHSFIFCSLTAIFLATLPYTKASKFNSEPKFMLKVEDNKAFDSSFLFKTFNMKSENIAECLEHCLQDCRCQSFQICQNTKCQLCSSHKEENSSLLQDKDGCVYAVYELRPSTQTSLKLDEQCSDMSCSMTYNCCQQSGVCPENKLCKPFKPNSNQPSWRRFTCECPDGYHGDNCDEPIRSCEWYWNDFKESGKYKVVDSGSSVYEAYCYFNFDFNFAWTLVQSYSFANRSLEQFKKPLFINLNISENDPTWSGYRLSNPRMNSIKDHSTFLLFTCDYEKTGLETDKTDYVAFRLSDISMLHGTENVDVLELSDFSSPIRIEEGSGQIGEYNLSRCQVQLRQDTNLTLHIVFANISDPTCGSPKFLCYRIQRVGFFGNYHSGSGCGDIFHGCMGNENSTTQLWFGGRFTEPRGSGHKGHDVDPTSAGPATVDISIG